MNRFDMVILNADVDCHHLWQSPQCQQPASCQLPQRGFDCTGFQINRTGKYQSEEKRNILKGIPHFPRYGKINFFAQIFRYFDLHMEVGLGEMYDTATRWNNQLYMAWGACLPDCDALNAGLGHLFQPAQDGQANKVLYCLLSSEEFHKQTNQYIHGHANELRQPEVLYG